ncbi:hypothetical protein BC834DRAFT_972944 [Gloeopeniophorella convolvens]|nr:hypothetical protein BC834DRAFT_972944 [Gloeopeniophorella convolvens]
MSSDRGDDDSDYITDDEEPNDPDVFRIWDSLEEPATTVYTTQQLHAMIHEGDIDLDPEYQRGQSRPPPRRALTGPNLPARPRAAVVWSAAKQMAVIDSLLHNYYIPPVVFAIVHDPDDGAETRLCVDGKQRLTSIQKFFDGQISYRCPKTKKQWWYNTSTATRVHRVEIPPAQKQAFASKLITCIEYRNLTPAAEREVFQRVQLGMSLTAAEKLQAIPSPWATLVGALERTHVSAPGGLAELIAVDGARARAFQNVAQLVFCCAGLPAARRAPGAAQLTRWLAAPTDSGPSPALRDALGSVLRRLRELARNRALDAAFRRFRAKVAPVEFVYIGVLLYVMRSGYTMAEQARAAYVLRRDVRRAHVDVRFNARVAADCWRIIDGVQSGTIDVSPGGASPAKRRKAREDDEDDGEWDDGDGALSATPTPPRARGKRKKT